MAIRTKKKELSEISQSSLADIAFLLLIFFIATTIFPTEKGIPLVLPGSTAVKKPIPRKNVLQITTDAQGSIFLNGEPSIPTRPTASWSTSSTR
jgi:biopolymer transport protein ExbD